MVIDNCETVETTARDQLMTIVLRLRRAPGGVRATLSCPRKSKVACSGRAGLAAKASDKPRRSARYRIRRGRRATVRVPGTGRHLILRERDQRRKPRRLVRRARRI